MNKIVKTLACACAAFAAASAWAQEGELGDDEDETAETVSPEAEETGGEGALTDAGAAKPVAKAPDGKTFHIMPLCRIVEGRCEYRLPGGSRVKFLDDQTTYLGNQLESEIREGLCFGVLANMEFILVCTYEKDGENPELILYRKR